MNYEKSTNLSLASSLISTPNSNANSPMTVAKAIRLSWASLANPAVLIRLLVPVFLSIVFSVAVLFWGWPLVTAELVPYLKTFSFVQTIFTNLDQWLGFSLLTTFALLAFIALVFFATYFVLILLASLVLVPLLNPIIQKKYFPQITKNSELSLVGSIKNSFLAIIYFFGFLILFSPLLFFIPGGQILVPYFLNTFLAKAVFPYDVLQDYATAAEYERFRLKENASLWTLSFLTGGYFYLPVINFLAAPMAALAFIFFSLGKLAEYRSR